MRRILGVIVVASVVAALSTPGVAARTRAGESLDDAEAAAVELLGSVPADVRGSCEINPPENNPPAFLAEVASIASDLACRSGTEEVRDTFYTKFTDLAAMNRIFDAYAARATGPTRSEEGRCPSVDTWEFGDTTAGRVTCFIDPGAAPNTPTPEPTPELAVRVWTAEDALIIGHARAAAADAEALFDWWNTQAGPLEDEEEVDGLADPSPKAIRAAEKRLRTQIPADQRGDCSPIDVGDPPSPQVLYASRQVLYASRLFVQAAFTCRLVEGVDSVTYWSVDPAHVDAFFLKYKSFSAAPPGEDCPGDGTWSVHGREVGEYACFASTEQRHPADKTDAFITVDVVRIVWTHRGKGFFGGATNDGTGFDRLFRFWKRDGGPVV